LAEQFRAAAALSAAAVHASEAHALAQLAAGEGRLTAEQLGALVAAQTGQREAFSAFGRAADPAQQQVADRVITGGAVAFTAASTAALLSSPEAAVGGSSFAGMVSSTAWVEDQLYDQLLASASALREKVFAQVLIESIAVLVALAVTVLVALLLARMLARSLRNLRASAIRVAEHDLPTTVQRLADPATLGENTPAQLAAQVSEPLAPRGRDEIGDVARAFNLVHRSAVKVAAEQAALRTSVAAMFLNLARRSQSLVDRMISQLDEIERNEEDPRRLARMFTLDHLATRMRRNDENLLTLAGADSSPPRTEDALLVDTLRAAQSEVEHYARIEFGAVDGDVSVIARAVNDVVRLVAELFDNATRFSPPDAPVVCEARRLRDHVIVQVEDRGVGMSADQVSRLNAWLASPPAVEVTTFRKMGLAVVARLAARHGMRVELRCDPNYGTVVYVALPPSILLLPPSRLRHHSTITTPELPPATAPPAAAPVPARYLGQRSADVVHHTATRRANSGRNHTSTGEGRDIHLPVAGRPTYQLTDGEQHAWPPPTPGASAAAENNTIELPIFKEAEAVWFANHGQQDLDLAGQAPRAGAYPTPAAHAEETATAATTLPATTPGHPDPADQWRTAADHGWQAAAAASHPPAAGATQSGLPKRQPQAQLVPGGVPTSTTHTGARPPAQRRSPEEVRGLLSAYHRGVKRGRETHTR
jgi:signal transduction histidine kinase